MARYTGPVCRLCRQEQMKLFLKGEKCYTHCVLDKNPAPPGPPPKRRKKMTEYAMRLREKQKLRRIFGLTEGPFKRIYFKAAKTKENTGDQFLRLLEVRLDNTVRRLGFAASLKTARQWVSHGHVQVNGRTVYIPSFVLKPGDRVRLSPKLKDNMAVKVGLDGVARRGTRPSFLEFEEATLTGKLLRWPDRSEISAPVQEHLIIEHYSK
ncbi:MAG: 30S ribosomal protein S4 [Elusimicrobia bacterium]|nr:30S ribosomal protein S4 [Elusimicrobiota bacterium]